MSGTEGQEEDRGMLLLGLSTLLKGEKKRRRERAGERSGNLKTRRQAPDQAHLFLKITLLGIAS